MRIFGSFTDFFNDIRTQRLRTLLTIMGITWGTVAVVVLLAFGVGLERQTRKRMHGLGERIVIVFGNRTTKTYEGFPEGRYIRLQEEDVDLLQREIPDILQISPEYSRWGVAVRRGRNSARPNVTGVYPAFGDMRNVIPDWGGRFINQADMHQRRRVAFLGNELTKLLFEDADAVGKQVFIGDVPFTVIGVLKEKQQSSSYNSRDRDRVFIPASTHRAIFGQRYLANIVYRTSTPEVTRGVEQRVNEVLGRKYRYHPSDDDALMEWDTHEFDQMANAIFLGMNIFLGIVGAFTLTVGGIGVANIMYIVVKERTREIGIRRSVGARKRDILLQFLGQAFVVVGSGAALGFLISLAIIRLGANLPMQEFVGRPTLSPVVATVTIVLLTGVALLAGYFPARKAANLDPVECLRY
ncbi:MAG: ABC transporter permease [Gemmatimonadota bacterium]|nr:MAG: ABC transporter permease [Gemmatimonadota bacterium]